MIVAFALGAVAGLIASCNGGAGDCEGAPSVDRTFDLPSWTLDDAALLNADGPPNCDALCAHVTGGVPVACAIGDASFSCTMRGLNCGQ